MVNFNNILDIAINRECSDIHLSVGTVVFGRINSKLERLTSEIIGQQEIITYAKEILGDKYDEIEKNGDVDISFSRSGLGRFRANVFKQRNSVAISIKIISILENKNEDFNFPNKIYDIISSTESGLILITGPVGSGKSTTISNIIKRISEECSKHIITIESSIEFLYKHNNSIVNQREICSDTVSYLSALEASIKENADIIFIDIIDNYDVLKMVLKCCDAGMLVISTLYANSVHDTLNNLLDMDTSNLNVNLRNSLSKLLKCIINQKIVLDNEDKNFCLFEIMINTPSIASCIRENKIKHILPLMQNGLKLGMSTLDISLVQAYKNSKISRNVLLQNISNKELATKIILNY